MRSGSIRALNFVSSLCHASKYTGVFVLFSFGMPAAAQTAAHSKLLPPTTGKTVKVSTGKSAGKDKPSPNTAAPAETVVNVTVRPNSDVAGKTFTLGEIADIQGDDKALAAQLGAVEVGASPLPGLSRIIYPGDVTVKLRQYHLESKRVEVILPPGIRITRAAHDIANDEITNAALESGKDAIKNLPDAVLEPAASGAKLTVPQGKTQIVAGAWRGTPETGAIYVPVSVSVDGKLFQTIEVTLKIHRKTIALVARHEIKLHDVLTPDDVALMPVDLPAGMTQPVTALETAIGKRATRRIPSDSPIGAEMLEKAPLINANESITIEYIYGALRVTAPGLARQTGAAGDTIRVVATDTKKELEGIVIDSRIVRIADPDAP